MKREAGGSGTEIRGPQYIWDHTPGTHEGQGEDLS